MTSRQHNLRDPVTRVAPDAARPAPLGSDREEHPVRRVSRLVGRRLP
jgi:hypothetical protein